MDVGSSQTAARVVGIVQGALKGLVIDIAVLLEGKTKVTFTVLALTFYSLLLYICKRKAPKPLSSFDAQKPIACRQNDLAMQEELPESLLGTVRLEHLDLSQAAKLDTSTGNIEQHT